MGNVVSFAAVRRALGDGYANLMSRLGTSSDRSTAGVYVTPVMDQQQVEAAYRSSWLTRKVHDLPPFEMTRAKRRWQAEQPQIEALEKAETAFDIWGLIRQALTTARLHGGAAIILGVRQGSPDQEVRPDALVKGSLRYAVVVSRFQLFAPQGFDMDPESPYFMRPAMFEMRGQRGNRVNIHPSRVITFHGNPLPPGTLSTSQIDQFWGDPLLFSIRSAIDNAEVSQAAVATLLHEMKQDVISIPGLTEQIGTDSAETRLAARIEAINRFKSMFNALLLDGGDPENAGAGKEEWETRQLSFAQHPELLRAFVGIVGGAADIPVTRLMGESPGGLQSTGKGEQDDFNRMIAAKRDAELTRPLAQLDAVLIPSTLGTRPPEIYYEFGDLEEADAKEESENDKRDAETVEIYHRTGLIPADALAKAAVNRMGESGRWPGLDQAIDESDQELGEVPETDPALPLPANENDVQQMEGRGAITRDQAMVLLTDASPRSLYVRRDVVNAAEIRAWAQGQGFTDIADDLHVTLVHSRTPIDWMKAGGGMVWGNDDGRLTVPPGGPRSVEVFADDAVVVEFSSTPLQWRHEEIVQAGAAHSYDEYRPHITIAKALPAGKEARDIEPYRGKIVLGPEIFEEVKPEPMPPLPAV